MADNAPLPVGTIVQDTYEILSFLGAGGMGSTYKARHIAMGHDVCVKVIHANLLQDERVLELFKREATLMRDLAQSGSSDAIVKIETLLRDGSGTHYLIMEFIEGKPLSHYIERGARLADDDVLALGRRLLSALNEIHAKNIVHRDISPDNIMVPEDTILKAKILDFGVATDVVGTEKSILGDSFAGKIGYASPEQLGLFDGKVSAKSDIYSLGLVLLAVAGVTPPGKGSMAAAVEVRKTDIKVEHKNLSAETSRSLEGLLRARPEDRAATLKADGQRPAPGPERSSRMPVVVGGLAVAAAIAAFAFLGMRPATDPPVASLEEEPQVTAPAEQTQTATQTAPKTEPEREQAPQVTAPDPTEAPAPRDVATIPDALPDPQPDPQPDPLPESVPAEQPPDIARVAPDPVDPEPSPPPEPPEPVAKPVPDETPRTPAEPAEPDEPLELARLLISQGGKDRTGRARDVLLEVMNDATAPQLDRAEAAALIGWMYDPKYHTAQTSAFATPNAENALKAYRFARKLGITSVQRDIIRLSN